MTLTPRRVPLTALAAAANGAVRGAGETAVSDVVLDTRTVTPGALFCCVPGARVDGHDLAPAALAAGAAALCVERPLDLAAPQLVVGPVRAALAPVAATFFGRPSRRLDLVGVTGTNGKTTTTFMLEAVLRAAGLVPGLVGTVEVRIGLERRPVAHTTPEAPDLQRLLADLAVVTSDNPRSEPPEAIVAEVAEGVRRTAAPGSWTVEVDRRVAIRQALAVAGPGDAVIVAGKGHEQGQEFAGGHTVPFDDRAVAAEELDRLAGQGGGSFP